jgi:hypothetical protein
MGLKHLYTSSSKNLYIKKSLLFVVLVIILAVLFQYFFEKKIILSTQSSSAYKIDRILHSDDEDEIPIFGASRAQGSFIPDVIGKDFFNYGIDGIRDNVVLFFLEQECKKEKHTPYVLMTFELDGYKNSLGDLNSYILNSGNKEVRALLGNDYRFYYKIPFIKYFGKYESYFKDYLNERMMLTKYKDKGASIEKLTLTKARFDGLVADRKNTETVFENDSLLEKQYIQLFKQHTDRTFILIIPPYHSSYFVQYKNYDEALNFLSYLTTFPNIIVLNYSHHFYTDECYSNTTHLNYKGAYAFSNMLKDTLQKIFARH